MQATGACEPSAITLQPIATRRRQGATDGMKKAPGQKPARRLRHRAEGRSPPASVQADWPVVKEPFASSPATTSQFTSLSRKFAR